MMGKEESSADEAILLLIRAEYFIRTGIARSKIKGHIEI